MRLKNVYSGIRYKCWNVKVDLQCNFTVVYGLYVSVIETLGLSWVRY